MAAVKLVSSEGDKLEVDVQAAKMSVLLATMIDDGGTDDEIPIANVNTRTLKKVIEYCKMHVNSPPAEIDKPLRSAYLTNLVSKEDYEFIDVDNEQLFELIMAANFLNIKPLLDLASAKVASLIKGRSVEEIRTMFNIQNDFTPEQEAQVREENKWCEDA